MPILERKGVHQRRRRKQDKSLVTELHVDFAFTSQRMQVGTAEQVSSHKVLILKEFFRPVLGLF